MVQQVWAIMEKTRGQGLKGWVKVLRERKTWHANGGFENVEMAEKAVAARKKGESLEGVFEQQREELKLTQRLRKNVVADMEQGGGDKRNEQNPIVQEEGNAKPERKDVPMISG